MSEQKPCPKDCPDRSVYCHTSCPKYLEFHKKRLEELEKINKQKALERDLRDGEMRTVIRWKKRKRK